MNLNTKQSKTWYSKLTLYTFSGLLFEQLFIMKYVSSQQKLDDLDIFYKNSFYVMASNPQLFYSFKKLYFISK